MVTSTFDVSDHPGSRPTRSPRPDGQILRHRLDVLAVDAVDVVQTTGGWLVDRVMGGWQVEVFLPGGCDARPLRILGVRVRDLASDLDMSGAMSQSLAVGVDALAVDDRIRDRVRKAVDNPVTEVALWGQGWPLGVDRGLTLARYTLSAAARAFKGQALRAAGICDTAAHPTESLFTDSGFLD